MELLHWNRTCAVAATGPPSALPLAFRGNFTHKKDDEPPPSTLPSPSDDAFASAMSTGLYFHFCDDVKIVFQKKKHSRLLFCHKRLRLSVDHWKTLQCHWYACHTCTGAVFLVELWFSVASFNMWKKILDWIGYFYKFCLSILTLLFVTKGKNNQPMRASMSLLLFATSQSGFELAAILVDGVRLRMFQGLRTSLVDTTFPYMKCQTWTFHCENEYWRLRF